MYSFVGEMNPIQLFDYLDSVFKKNEDYHTLAKASVA
jgi:hypothetical protein